MTLAVDLGRKATKQTNKMLGSAELFITKVITVKKLHICSLLPQNVFTIEARHGISYNVVCATSKASDQPAYMHSLIRAFASHLNVLYLLSY